MGCGSERPALGLHGTVQDPVEGGGGDAELLRRVFARPVVEHPQPDRLRVAWMNAR